MKRIGNLYDKIYDIDNIREAHRNARKRKTHYKEVKEVDADVDKHCYEIQAMLRDKTFVKGNYQVHRVDDRGLDFLGYRIFCRYTLLRTKIATSIKRSNKTASLTSYNGWIVSSSGYNLAKSKGMI